MKHWSLITIGLVLAVFLFGTSALTQQERGDQDITIQSVEHAERGYINNGSVHKLMIGSEDIAVYNELASRGAIVGEIDYGSFKLIRVNEQAAGGRESLATLSLPVRDDQDLIMLNGLVLDTNQPETLSAQLPAELRQHDMADAIANGGDPRGGLYVIQFAGPIKDSWLRKLQAAGAEIVSYVASNAYVVRASAGAARELIRFKTDNSFVQFAGDYEPAFRMTPMMRAAHASSGEATIDITVQVIGGRGARRTIDRLMQIASAIAEPSTCSTIKTSSSACLLQGSPKSLTSTTYSPLKSAALSDGWMRLRGRSLQAISPATSRPDLAI